MKIPRRVMLISTTMELLFAGNRRTSATGLPALVRAGNVGPVTPRLAMGDVRNARLGSVDHIRQRFDRYRELGFGAIRTSVNWSSREEKPGSWVSLQNDRYFSEAAREKIQLKLIFSTWGSAPNWFMQQNGDAKLKDNAGNSHPSYISPWFPGLTSLLAEKTEHIMSLARDAGMFEHIGHVIVDLGPAGEPIYPADWEVSSRPKSGNGSYWFYDGHAQASFPKKMEEHFGGSLDAANRRWATSFKKWNEVNVPVEGSARGPLWEDVLLWYYQAKRDVIISQVTNTIRLLKQYSPAHQPGTIILVPGGHVTQDERKAAIQSGGGDGRVKVASDTDFLVQLAARENCGLQPTAIQNETQVAYLRNMISASGLAIKLWGENAGGIPAKDLGHLADVVERQHLAGMDYIGADDIFGDDKITPNNTFKLLQDATRRLVTTLSRQAD